MFDQYHSHQHHTTERVEVTRYEHRAPTDESVRLLKEFEEAARSKILKSTPLESNGFHFVVHHACSQLDLEHLFLLHYELNGKRREVRVRVPMGGEKVTCSIGA